jgi:hypothetical protein
MNKKLNPTIKDVNKLSIGQKVKVTSLANKLYCNCEKSSLIGKAKS